VNIPEGDYYDRVLYGASLYLNPRRRSAEECARIAGDVRPEDVNRVVIRILQGEVSAQQKGFVA
jgi:hypothetical protein